MKLSQIDVAAWSPQRVLVFGDSKTGKTTLAAELAKRFRVWWFDLENGMKPLLKLPKEAQGRIELFKIPDTTNYPIAIETMMKLVTGVPLKICHLHGKAGCDLCAKANPGKEDWYSAINLRELGKDDVLVIDSLTQMGISAMNRIIHGKPEDYKSDWEDYRKQGVMLDRVLSNIQQSWYNVVCISHTTQAKLEDTTKIKLVPVCGTDNFSRNVAKYFDHVIYCELGTGEHKFGSSTTYRPQVLTGSRTDIKIEDMKKGETSLMPFFDGTIQAPKVDATKTLTDAAAKVANLTKK